MGGAASVMGSTADWLRLNEILGRSSADSNLEKSAYEIVSKKIKTVDVPFDGSITSGRDVFTIASSGYGTPSEKAMVFVALTLIGKLHVQRLFFTERSAPEDQVPRPSILTRVLLQVGDDANAVFLDPSMEVSPFGLLSAKIRGGKALRFYGCAYNRDYCWMTIPEDPPFASTQHVNVDAFLGADGKLNAKVRYKLRGDNELLLRVAFHQTPKERWKEVAQLLALSDGFRGQVANVIASDPYATGEPFTVEYEISQPKFVDWTKKPVRIPALLPQVGLPDPPAKPVAGSATSPIKLGTPLDVETTMTLHLPQGTTTHAPTGIAVERDYATFSSQYSEKSSTVTASRHIRFLLREVPGTRVADYNAFLRAVQNDSAQDFTLERPEVSPAKTDSAAPATAAPPNPTPQKP
jgi:hypothetical protein